MPIRVLLIEDDDNCAILVRRALTRYQSEHAETEFVVTTVLGSGPRSGLEPLLAIAWDVILCDYVLPGGPSWPDIYGVIRACTPVPIIVISGKSSDDQGLLAIQLGADDYVNKAKLDRLGRAVEVAHQRHESLMRQAEAIKRLAGKE